MDQRFGRCEGFMIVDTETGQAEYKGNLQNMELSSGAGIQAAQSVADTGAKAVVTGRVGPKAFAALNKGGIDIYLADGGTVGEAVEAFKAGKLPKADAGSQPMGAGKGRGGGAGMGGRMGQGGGMGPGGGRGMGGGRGRS
jgi:predicted Fe-Mo cluster-binding NifX family protein